MMKKHALFLCTCALSGAASAQSSVTLYGVVDEALTFVSNAKGGRQYLMTNGNEAGNRWGLTGAEDLGGGLKAIFTLEAGYAGSNGTIGQNGTEFGRQAFVGLASTRYGTLTLGRQYSTVYQVVAPITAVGDWAAAGSGFGAHPGDADNLDSSNRINNAIKYQSVNYRGFTFGGLYSLGGKTGQFAQNSIWDISAAYANGPLKAAVGYVHANSPNYSFWGDKANDSTTASNITNPIAGGYASAGSQQIIAAAAQYAMGPFTVGAAYTNTRFGKLGSVTVAGLNAAEAKYTGTASLNTGEVNVKYRPVPALLLAASYAYTENSGASGQAKAHYNQVDLGALYSLSKRTTLYAVAVYQAARGTDSTGAKAVADLVGISPSSNGTQTLVTLGINHRF
jgi:predicted porin